MKTNYKLKAATILFVTALAGAGSALAADSLLLVPTLAGDTSNSGRGVTPDGRYVVGLSGQRGFLYEVGSASAINILSSDSAQSQIATGVGYRTSGGATELVVSGLSSGYVTEWMTTDGGSSWAVKRRDTTFTANTMPTVNSIGASLGSDSYFVISRPSDGSSVSLNKLTGPWVPTITYSAKSIASGDSARMNAVSASGRAVGSRVNTSIRKNYMLTWNGTGTPANSYFNGLDGTQAGEAFAVSSDGNTVFGQSPKVGNASLFGYKVLNPGTSQTVNDLPLFGDETGSTSLQVPYGTTMDGGLAVGMAYRGTEKAALWFTYGDRAGWYALDLTEVARSEGLLGDFTRLSRAYSVAYDAQGDYVITGQGALADGSTRAFVLTIVPEPSTMALLALGSLLLLRRRH